MTDTKPLAGQTALVTGASRGIGAATAIALAEAGAHVIITARKVKELEAVEDHVGRLGDGHVGGRLLPHDKLLAPHVLQQGIVEVSGLSLGLDFDSRDFKPRRFKRAVWQADVELQFRAMSQSKRAVR